MSNNLSTTMIIFKRELRSYFESPVAYVFLIVFLVLLNSLAFLWPGLQLYERRTADMSSFFFWLPLVYLLLVPAASMGTWAEERRDGTIELLLTMPVTLTQAVLGKFLASWAFITIALALTFPMAITVAYLGDPDGGVIFCGYLGAFFMAGAYVAIGTLMSATTRNQVISFVLAVITCLVLVLAGTPFITHLFSGWMPAKLVSFVAALSFWTHFEALQRGVLDMVDVGYYISVIAFMVVATHLVLDNRKHA